MAGTGVTFVIERGRYRIAGGGCGS